jgi:hypothetical protein
MIALLALALATNPLAGPAAPKEGPQPSELAKLYFIAGDLSRAHDALNAGVKRDPKCEPMLRALADYQYLVSRSDRLTPADAKQLFALDRALSPQAMGKITKPVHDRFVAMPLLKAKARLDAGLTQEALGFARAAYDADPYDADAVATMSRLGVDAGTPVDGGR